MMSSSRLVFSRPCLSVVEHAANDRDHVQAIRVYFGRERLTLFFA